MRVESKIGSFNSASKVDVVRSVNVIRNELIRTKGVHYALGYFEGTLLKSFQQLPESDKNRILLQMLDKVDLL